METTAPAGAAATETTATGEIFDAVAFVATSRTRAVGVEVNVANAAASVVHLPSFAAVRSQVAPHRCRRRCCHRREARG